MANYADDYAEVTGTSDSTTDEDNGAIRTIADLKNQVEIDDRERSSKSVVNFTQNNEELEILKSQLAELQVILRKKLVKMSSFDIV